jgi:ABC-type multidrug transport system permease subunit
MFQAINDGMIQGWFIFGAVWGFTLGFVCLFFVITVAARLVDSIWKIGKFLLRGL